MWWWDYEMYTITITRSQFTDLYIRWRIYTAFIICECVEMKPKILIGFSGEIKNATKIEWKKKIKNENLLMN